jgi:hypothetical protein
VGSSGAKRRSPKGSARRRDASLRGVGDSPPVMWPEEGSGFEADPFSPAGTAERRWLLIRNAGNIARNRSAMWILAGAIGFVAIVVLVGVAISAMTGN